jgi:hypothetical protein
MGRRWPPPAVVALDLSAAEATPARADPVCIALYRDTNRVIQVKQTAPAFVANAAHGHFRAFGGCFTLYRETKRVIQMKQTTPAFVANAAARAFPSFWRSWRITRRPFVSRAQPPLSSPEYVGCPGVISDPRRADHPPFRALGPAARSRRPCNICFTPLQHREKRVEQVEQTARLRREAIFSSACDWPRKRAMNSPAGKNILKRHCA